MSSAYWLTNVRLESGYRMENGTIAGTETEICHLRMEGGIIREIAPAAAPLITGLPRLDAGELLLLPSFIEKHVHLDKTLLGDAWRAVIPAPGVAGRCEVEKRILPSLPTSSKARAELLLDTLLKSGSTEVRTHVDLYPDAGLRYLEAVQQALETFEGKLSSEIVAFPQHGLLRSHATQLVREALRQGATLVGGVDPATVDGDIEASLQQMMELAVEANAGVDLHLHDPDYLGTYTMRRLAALTMEAGLQGRVAVSHAFGIGDVPAGEAADLAAVLAEAGITVITSVPHSRVIPPVPLLRDHGVNVAVGCDNIFDTWQPYGNGDLLERAGRLAERFRWIDERSLGQSLGFITGGRTPLDAEGRRAWPNVGDEASMLLVDASCSAEAVARRAERKAVFFRGALVAGGLGE
ncbi:amidohydrolase [Paenibacillus sp. MBLB4367]|uniref:amidohydrolase n=1 Tax=Paenibacillus sp. MBLB4367 TaxID=3384767 RepID=UPI0039081053